MPSEIAECLQEVLIKRFEMDTQIDNLLLPYHLDLSIFSHIVDSDLVEHIHRKGIIFYTAD